MSYVRLQAAIVLVPVLLMSSLALAQERVQSGTLACNVAPGIGMIIGAEEALSCTFTPVAGGPLEQYRGTLSKFGLDLGITSGGQMVWGVFAPATRQVGALAGTYDGVSAEASVGLGLGANVLLGGSQGSVALQPVSMDAQAGLNLAVGVAQLRLRYVP